MTGLEIILLIVGFSCLCISYFVAQKRMPQQESAQTAAVWTEKEEQMIRQRVDEILSDRQSEMIDETEEQMNRLCNDKIMAVDEFSKQILEKIKSNHHEVVFMYNMLNEKKKEVTDIVTTIPVRMPEESKEKNGIPGAAEESRGTQETSQKDVGSGKEKNSGGVVLKEAGQPESDRQPAERDSEPDRQLKSSAIIDSESQRLSGVQPQTALDVLTSKGEGEADVRRAEEQMVHEEIVREQKPQKTSVPGSVNLQIQKMHKEGKSVLEISKALNIGQGEVKLVIALYGNRKG